MKLKSLTIATCVALGSLSVPQAYSSSNALPMGPNLSYGDASNNHTIYSITTNPAWAGGNLHVENNYGFALGGGIRIQQTDFNTLVNEYNANVKPLLEGSGTNAIAKADELQKQVTGLILTTRDQFDFQLDATGSIPIQISHNKVGGFGFEISGSSTAKAKLLSTNKPIDIDTSALTANSTNQDIINATTVQSGFYLKTATYTELAATYGNEFFENKYGRLSAGIKAKYMQASLVKSVNSLKKYLEASVNNKDLGEQLNDDFSAHSNSDTENQIGVDLGVQWFAENWMAGLTMMNINSPKFTYNNLASLGTTADAYVFRDQINLTESVELIPQSRVEAAVYSENRQWTLAGSADLSSTYDLVNNEYQWATASVSFASDSGEAWWAALIPDVRVGYRSNLVGDMRSYITPGFTWGPLNLDLGFQSFEDLSKIGGGGDTTGDSVDLPEAFIANIGLEFYF